MATKTLGLIGRDYSTLAAWATYVNALSLAANEILEVYNDGGAVADTAKVTVGGWTANGFTVTMRPASGNGIKDHANRLTNALRWDASNGAALTNNTGYDHAYAFTGANLVIEDLQILATNSAASSTAFITGGAVLNRSIVARMGGPQYVIVQGSSGFTLNDCIVMHADGSGIQALSAGMVLNNCTLASIGGSGTGIAQPYSVAPVAKNCVFYNFTVDVAGTAGGATTNNATSKASFGGTGWGTSGQTSVSSADFENVSAGTEDFRIKSGSAKLIDTGASAIGSGSDVVGTSRSGTYDIGAWETAASSAPTLTSPTVTVTGTGTTATVGATTTVATGTLYALARIGGSAADAATIRSTGQSAAVSTTTPNISYTGLTANTGSYYVDFTQRDGSSNDSAVVTAGPFSTDVTSPTLSSAAGSSAAPLACQGTVSTNEATGTLYTVATASATAPSAAQVKAGQDHTGSAALRVVSQAVSGTGTQTVASGSVTAGTRYLHYMHEDAAGNQSTVASSASFVVASSYTITTDALEDETNTVLASTLIAKLAAVKLSDMTVTCTWTNQTTDGSGVLTLSHASLTAVPHLLLTSSSDGADAGAKVYTPA